jgi:hypothetical protein
VHLVHDLKEVLANLVAKVSIKAVWPHDLFHDRLEGLVLNFLLRRQAGAILPLILDHIAPCGGAFSGKGPPHHSSRASTRGSASSARGGRWHLWILDPVFPVLSLDVLLQRHAVLPVTGQGKQDCTKLGQATQLYV